MHKAGYPIATEIDLVGRKVVCNTRRLSRCSDETQEITRTMRSDPSASLRARGCGTHGAVLPGDSGDGACVKRQIQRLTGKLAADLLLISTIR
jgi:hypothetical protein